MIRIKRAYESPASTDGDRILIDRLWPRGLTKERARIDAWRRDLAPSDELREWYGHQADRFPRFRERYRMELLRNRAALVELALATERGPVTLVYAAKDADHSNATVLRELLEEVIRVEPTTSRDASSMRAATGRARKARN